ncbi:MAG: DNA repair protein RadC [Lactobacillales bacterium]|jgi:DNA repair protein RadC|nr:DNA repair protein RadC [Lactobacillales bacterium]
MTPEKPDYLGHRARLLDKLLKKGTDVFEDYEFLELILTRAIPRKDVKPLAKKLIARFDSLPGVLYADPAELTRIPGIKQSTVGLFKIIVGACQRLAHFDMKKGPILNRWDKLLDYCFLTLSAEEIEHFHILYLDKRLKLILDEEHQKGTVDYTSLYPREVLKRALNLNASSIVLVHNHPSGNPEPSKEDIRTTLFLKEALLTLDIHVHDHLIIGKAKKVFSFKEKSLI